MLNQTNRKIRHVFFVAFLSMTFGSSFLLADVGNFHLHCPHDVWIDCDDPLYDLDIYGEAYIEYDGQHLPAPEPYVHWHVDDCGGGYIKRKWQVSDPWGKWHKCTQYIHIGSGGVFDENDIYWPHDYHTYDCNESTHPDDLDHPYDYPVIHEEECAMIFYSYKDWVFTQSGGGPCKKILRKWKIIDWCVYEPNNPYTKGIWTHTQVIKIWNSAPPELTCPADFTVSAELECYAWVDFPEVLVGGDCSEYTEVFNDSPFAFDNGADASGTYPVGTTKVCFTADDGCGNDTECCVYVTVEDGKKPTPYCYSGIVITLGMQYDGYYRVCPPYILDKGSVDNCTAQEDLIIWIEPDTFTCEDLGETPVTMYVEDESGNVNFCETFIIVQDNMDMCPPADSLTINGNVHTFKKDMVDDVLVKNMMTGEEIMTTDDGMFSLGGLFAEEDYMVSAEKDTDPLEGVTMEDLTTLSNHLFGIETFENGYLYIAADVNNNEQVNLEDFLLLRDLILGNYNDFDDFSDQTSWRFVKDGYEFADFENPWGWESEIMFYEIGNSQHNKNFVGVKIGDINEDLFENFETNTNITELRSKSIIKLVDQEFASGEDVTIEVPLHFGEQVIGADIELDLDGLTISSVESNNENVAYKITNGGLRILAVRTDTDLNSALLTLKAKAHIDGDLSSQLSLVSGSHLYNRSRSYDELVLHFEGMASERFIMHEVSPNPFNEEAVVSFELPEAGSYVFSLSDLDGRVISSQNLSGVQGMNRLVMNGDQFSDSGIYIATIEFKGEKQSVKIAYSK